MASRGDPRETDDMAYAAMRMAEAAERMAEALSHLQGGRLTEEEADRLALAAVHRDRAAAERVAEDRPPGPEDVEFWVYHREQLRGIEGRGDF